MELYDELLEELECPICTNYMSPPILQCVNGHSICEACRRRLYMCALCRGKFTESRNLSLERLAVKMHCPSISKSSERESHEVRRFKCAMKRCPWMGGLEDLAAHWASKMYSTPYHESNVCYTKMNKSSYYVNMVDAHNKLFWFKCKLAKNKLFWAVQFIGNATEAENYFYEIEIIKPEGTKKKILMSDYCQSIVLENSQLFNDGNCISVDLDTIFNFVQNTDQHQFLLYYLRVNFVKDEKFQAQSSFSAIYLSLMTLHITFFLYKTGAITFPFFKLFDYNYWYPRPWYKKIWYSILRI